MVPYSTKVDMNDSDQRASLLQYGDSHENSLLHFYGCNWFL